MPSYLDRITKLVPPPRRPLKPGSRKMWQDAEKRLGLQLPADFKALTSIYGTGQWQDFWMLLNPFTDNKFLNLCVQSKKGTRGLHTMLDAERYLRDDPDYPYPEHPIHPEFGGILPFGQTDNGGNLFWLTKGSNKRWPIIYCPRHTYDTYPISTTRFVYEVLTGDLLLFEDELGDDFQYGQPDAFVGWRLTAKGGAPLAGEAG